MTASDPAECSPAPHQRIWVQAQLTHKNPDSQHPRSVKSTAAAPVGCGSAAPVADGVFEVTVTATVQTKIKDKTVFLVEATQAGIFEIRNLPQEQMGQVMGIACPQIVYPYLRGNVADLVQRGGFPPVHLQEINFQAMYEQQQAANQ